MVVINLYVVVKPLLNVKNVIKLSILNVSKKQNFPFVIVLIIVVTASPQSNPAIIPLDKGLQKIPHQILIQTIFMMRT